MPTTVEKLRAKADALEEEGWAALDRGDRESALRAFQRAQDARAVADELEADPRGAELDPGKQKTLLGNDDTAIVYRPMTFTAEHRANMSKARAPDSKLAKLARKLNPPLTLAALAEKAGVSKATLTRASKGDRPLPLRAAEKIQELTGYPVSSWRRLS